MSPKYIVVFTGQARKCTLLGKTFDFIPGVNRIKGVASMLREHDEEIKGWKDYSKKPGMQFKLIHIPMVQKYYFNNYLKPKVDNLLSKTKTPNDSR